LTTLTSGNEDLTVINRFNIELKTSHMACLREGRWLNDEVINFFMELLNVRSKGCWNSDHLPKLKCYCFSTFFAPKALHDYDYKLLKKWSKAAKIKIVEFDKLLFPVHSGNNHWCLCVVNFKDKRFEYYDSLGGKNNHLLSFMRCYVRDELAAYSEINYNFKGWTNYTPTNIPHQTNGNDCGVFMCKYADYIAEGLEFKFGQANMLYFRARMALELSTGCVQCTHSPTRIGGYTSILFYSLLSPSRQ
jgi:sentrin-specific protease 1